MAIGPGYKPDKEKEFNPFELTEEDRKEILGGKCTPAELTSAEVYISENYPKKDLPLAVRGSGVFDAKRSALEMIRDGEAKAVMAQIRAWSEMAAGTLRMGKDKANPDTSMPINFEGLL